MTCIQIKDGFVCSHTTDNVYICLEHTTYLMEFSPMFGPSWFTVPDDKNIFPDPGGHLGFLWDIFNEWYYGEKDDSELSSNSCRLEDSE